MSDFWEDDDDLLFDTDGLGKPPSEPKAPWRMLVVDDEPDIHVVTKLALQNFSFDDRALELISAYNATEALEILTNTPDIAVVLLDVVMETDHAGLDCARHIRHDLNNQTVRIVLRTGQPGQAPEDDVILGFDINDYRDKTELTEKRLFTTIISALRAYRDLMALEQYRLDAYRLLLENNQSIQSLINQSKMALFQLDKQFDIQRCTQTFADLFGETPEKMIGKSMADFITADLQMNYQGKQALLESVKREEGSIICYTGALLP